MLRKNNQAIQNLNRIKELYERDVEDFKHGELIDTEIEAVNDYKTNSLDFSISFLELVMFNDYFHSSYLKRKSPIHVMSYGNSDTLGRINYGGNFYNGGKFWFNVKLDDVDNEFIFNTSSWLDNNEIIICQLHVTSMNPIDMNEFEEIYKKIKSLAFNNSQYVGKCIKVKLRDSLFMGIEIIDFNKHNVDLILTETQNKYIEHFINRVKRGSSARYLLNGEPGTGKTESIRDIVRKLTPDVTFIIPDFVGVNDLTTILEACEIFDKGVIIMDDIDLYLGSREQGNYTRFLGEFLSFFDGVKKRKISLLASTNDKGLVDKAAERPGRFNMTIDYTYLTYEQIIKVCKIHLPEKYQIDEIYNALCGTVNGRKIKITGAFIANLSENIKEMSEDEENWTIEDTISLINESYRGFYMSQYDKNTNNIGFKTD